MRFPAALPFVCLAGSLCALLAGCGVSSAPLDADGDAMAGVPLAGSVTAGGQATRGAVYLLAANTTGNGGRGIAPSAANASVSLLTPKVLSRYAGASGMDANGNYYVMTDQSGSFSIPNQYVCTAGQQVYLYFVGADPVRGGSSPVTLMTALGGCPGTSFAQQYPVVVINEATTIAAAYAFGPYASDATHVSSSATAFTSRALANSFMNASNLVSVVTGQALSKTPAGYGTVPQAKINAMVALFQTCTGAASAASGCTTLFNFASTGGPGATPATDTASAAIQLAHYPGAANAYAIVGYADLSLAIRFIQTAQTESGGPGIDAKGHVWTTGYIGGLVTYGPMAYFVADTLGVPLPGSPFLKSSIDISATPYASGYPSSTGTDASGNVWKPGPNDNVSKYSPTGVLLSPAAGYPSGGYTGNSSNYMCFVAVDGDSNVWAASRGLHVNNSVVEYANNGNLLSPQTSMGTGYSPDDDFFSIEDVVIDGSGNIWTDYYSYGGVYGLVEYIGLATPVLTPMAVAAGSKMFGVRP